MEAKRSRTTFFDDRGKGSMAFDVEYGDPEFSTASRAGALNLVARYAQLVLPDKLYAAEVADEGAACVAEWVVVGIANAYVIGQVSLVGAAVVARAAAYGAWAAAAAAVVAGAKGPALIARVAAAAALSAAELYLTACRKNLAIAVAAAAAADYFLWKCLYPDPKPVDSGSGGGGGGGDGGDTSGGGDTGGGEGHSEDCTFYAAVNDFGYILWIEDPNSCLSAA